MVILKKKKKQIVKLFLLLLKIQKIFKMKQILMLKKQ